MNMILQTIHDRMKGKEYDEIERDYLLGYAYEFGVKEFITAMETGNNESVQRILCRCIDALNPTHANEYKEFVNTHDWVNTEE